MDELTGQYKSEAKFMGFGPHFNIALGIKSIGVTFEVEKVRSFNRLPLIANQ